MGRTYRSCLHSAPRHIEDRGLPGAGTTVSADYCLARAFDTNALPYIRIATVTLEQVVRPFQVWQTDYLLKAFELPVKREGWALVFRLVSTLQSALSLGLIATSLLALRRRFKLD